MLTDELFQRILVQPASLCDELTIVSGYISASMMSRHVLGRWADGRRVSGLPEHCRVSVTYGMYPVAGVDIQDHKLICSMMQDHDRLRVNYCVDTPVHSKVYVWSRNGVPQIAYVGSANYTLNGFAGNQLESCAVEDANSAIEFCRSLEARSQVASEIVKPRFRVVTNEAFDRGDYEFGVAVERLDSVRLPLYSVKSGRMHLRAGLNWGQRPGRDRNQAYIPVPATIARDRFFPTRGEPFSLLTDDGECFECVIAQAGDKGIETPASNALLGLYFRKRLGVPSGAFVDLADLDQFGSRWVTVYKTDENRFFLRYAPE